MTTALPSLGAQKERRVRPLSLIAAFLRRDWKVARSYRMAFALQGFQSLWGLALVYFLSRFLGPALAKSDPALRDGYFAYAAIGVTLLSVLSVALIIFAGKLRQDQQTGTFETVLASPTPPWLIVLASSCYDLIYATVAGALTLIFAIVVFGLRLHGSPAEYGLSILILVSSLGVFAAFGVAYAAFVVVFKRGDAIMSLLTAVMGLAGGVFYPVTVLPKVVQPLAQVFPLTQAATTLRDTLLYHQLPLAKVAELCGSAIILLPPALWLFDRSVRHARAVGTLGQY